MSIHVFNTVTQKYIAADVISALRGEVVPREFDSREAARDWIDGYVRMGIWYTSGEREDEFVEHSDFAIEVDGVRQSVVA